MKILHSADLHLGSPLRSVTARDAALGARLADAMDALLPALVDTAIAEEVDAVVLAGDVFDGDVADVALRAGLAANLRRLVRAGIPVVMIRGNHDALMDFERYGPLGDGIHLLHREAPSVRIKGATFHGVGFHARHADRSLLPFYPRPEAGRINVGLMHTSLDGAAGHDPYAPCALSDLLAHGYDYWALGHIHKRSERIAEGGAVVMPGIPQGRHANEEGIGSVTVATLGGAPALRAVPVAQVAFHHRRLDGLPAESQGALIDAFAAAAPARDGRHHLLRFAVAGGDLSTAALRDIAAAALAEREDVGVEAVRRIAGHRPPPPEGLLRLTHEEAASASFRDEAARLLGDLRDALPPEIAGALAEEELDDLLHDGLRAVAEALRGGGAA